LYTNTSAAEAASVTQDIIARTLGRNQVLVLINPPLAFRRPTQRGISHIKVIAALVPAAMDLWRILLHIWRIRPDGKHRSF
jgi:hypothetical protein